MSAAAVKQVMAESKTNRELLHRLATMPVDVKVKKANSKKKLELATGDHMLQPQDDGVANPKKGQLAFYSDQKLQFVKKGGSKPKAQKQNMWSGIDGSRLLQPRLSKAEIRRLANTPLTVDEEVLEAHREREDLEAEIREMQSNVQMEAPEAPYTFPDTEYAYDYTKALQTSIASYKARKNMFNIAPSQLRRN